jgi:hypothetical protein
VPKVDIGWRRRTAWALAVAADVAQWLLFPVFAPGIASSFDDALDCSIGVALVALLGFHWSFLPAMAVELLPVADLAPTWTLAVAIATRGARKAAQAESAASPSLGAPGDG